MTLTGQRAQKLAAVCLLLLLAWLFVSPTALSAFAGLGGYISEKMLGDGTNEALHLGDGTNQLSVLGSGPIVFTGTATSTSAGGIVSATLHGNLASLNGMPKADVWFVWGYAPGVMTNTTAQVSVTTLGDKTATINPLAGKTVYYRFVGGTDGTTSSGILSVLAGGAHGLSYWLMSTLLPLIIAAVILIMSFATTRNPIIALIAMIIGLVGFYIVLAIVSTL